MEEETDEEERRNAKMNTKKMSNRSRKQESIQLINVFQDSLTVYIFGKEATIIKFFSLLYLLVSPFHGVVSRQCSYTVQLITAPKAHSHTLLF